MSKLKVVAGAYSCEPNKGSEPGIGWNIVRGLARVHDMWLITRVNNRPSIEAALCTDPAPGLHVVYYDMPRWARWWKRGTRGLQLYYYLWQIGAYRLARRLHRRHRFDLAHHVTFGRYWNPSFLSLLPIPFVWGPVGGGESTPPAFLRTFGWRGRAYERLRETVRALGERDPFVRRTAERSHVALATTAETAVRLRALGADAVEYLGNAALNTEEINELRATPAPPDRPFRFVSAGRMLHWKGFHLALEAFAEADVPDAEYWFVGDGPERARLAALADRLGVADRVTFWGNLPRSEFLARLADCHVLLHPSLHDSGGWVCIEAMAAGRPVACLDLGGPAVLVNDGTGIKVPARDPGRAVHALSRAIARLAGDPARYGAMAAAARAAADEYTWEAKVEQIDRLYRRIAGGAAPDAPNEGVGDAYDATTSKHAA